MYPPGPRIITSLLPGMQPISHRIQGTVKFTYMKGSMFYCFHVGKYSVRPMDFLTTCPLDCKVCFPGVNVPGCHLASKKKFFRERRGTRGTKGGRFDVNVTPWHETNMTGWKKTTASIWWIVFFALSACHLTWLKV